MLSGHIDARITYSKEWSLTDTDHTQVEGFQNWNFLENYIKVMDWRIKGYEII